MAKFEFNREWGVKCRFHDFEEYNLVDSACIEFHCSDKDLDCSKVITSPNKSLIIHAPEILGKELLDLCSADLALQDRSNFSLRSNNQNDGTDAQGFRKK